MRRLVVIIAALIILTPVSGVLLQSFSTSRDQARLEPLGERIEVGGAQLQVFCQGDPGARMLLLENGMGVVSDAWTRLQEMLATSYRVCSYDRAGTGHSAHFDGAQDAAASADRLSGLVEALEADGPVIIVGHSFGGLVARVFADRYPHLTAGLVLVDSAHEDMGERLPPEGRALVDDILNAFGVLRTANRFGVLRVTGPPAPWMNGLEGPAHERARAVYSSVAHMRGAAAEAQSWRDGRSTTAARDIETLTDTPMLILVADDYPHGLAEPWLELQRELAALSNRSRLRVVAGADHFGLIQEAEHARSVYREIDTFVQWLGTD